MRGKIIGIFIVLVLILIYLGTGVYQVGPSEVALIKTFGKYTHTSGPGMHFHLPVPFQTHVIVDVESIRKIEIGFRTVNDRYGKVTYESVPAESLMITGDGNIVSVEAVIQYKINDPVAFAFNILSDEDLVRFTTESVLRENVAMVKIDEVLTVGRDKIAMDTAKRVQQILDKYNAGIIVENVLLQEVAPPDEVLEAFDDVNNAKQDKERLINEANKYANDVVPKSEGQAQKILKEAQAYANEVYLRAKGDVERFLKVYKEYKKAPEVMKARLLYDAMERFLSASTVLVNLDSETLKILDLQKMLRGDGK
ncbi:MAG: FtsH protease activity modulator HflK [Thermotogaceae bacterium]|nr:FtsH protease activity modulator HflK [Thermotogaceae bacterium]